MVDADKVEVMIALPGQLFFNTQIPACLWFLVKEKRNRQGEVLFIDARKLGSMISRVQCEFTDEIIEKIANTVEAWRGEIPLNPPFPKGEAETPHFSKAEADNSPLSKSEAGIPPFEKGGPGGNGTYLSFLGWPFLRISSRACALGFISLG